MTTRVIVAADAGGAAPPASAATADDSGSVSSTGSKTYQVGLDFHVDGVTLSDGHQLVNDRIGMSFTNDTDGNLEIDAAWDYWSTYACSKATYSIAQDGEDTGYYIHPHIRTKFYTSAPGVGGEVSLGEPGNGGGVAANAPFSCDVSKQPSQQRLGLRRPPLRPLTLPHHTEGPTWGENLR